jgi:hypothetical protein
VTERFLKTQAHFQRLVAGGWPAVALESPDTMRLYVHGLLEECLKDADALADMSIAVPCHNCGKDAYGGAICCNTCDESSI